MSAHPSRILLPPRDRLERYHIDTLRDVDLRDARRPFFIDGVTEDWPARRWARLWSRQGLVEVLDGIAPFHLHAAYNQTLAELLDVVQAERAHQRHALRGEALRRRRGE